MVSSATVQRVLAGVLVALLAAIAVILLVARGAHSGAGTAQARSQFDGPTLPAGLRAPSFTLTDQQGRRVSLGSERGHVVVLTFIHSLCKDTCPLMTEQIKGALNLLPGRGRDVPAIGISADPREDTLHNRRAFLAKHEMTGRMAFVNGPRSELKRIWKGYSVEPVGGRFDHTTYVMLIDKRGYERVGFPASVLTPEGLAHDIRVLQRERA